MNRIDGFELYDALKDIIPDDIGVVEDPDDFDVEDFMDYLWQEYDPVEIVNLVLERVIVARTMITDTLVVGLPDAHQEGVFAWKKDV